jgi:hypothetical protein
MAKMSTLDLQALVNSSRTDLLAALSAINLSDERAKAMDYYRRARFLIRCGCFARPIEDPKNGMTP